MIGMWSRIRDERRGLGGISLVVVLSLHWLPALFAAPPPPIVDERWNVTVMEFKNAEGSPNVITIGQLSSDRWVLRRVDPRDPSTTFWEPLP